MQNIHPGQKAIIAYRPYCKICKLAREHFLPPGVKEIFALRPAGGFCLKAACVQKSTAR
jgi:hypothetical protein